MSDQLPHFRYHPDPVATGSVQGSAAECAVCGRARGWAYAGPVYAGEELDGEICPWCIADGSAAAQLEAEFTDTGWGAPDDVPQPVCQEIAQRTPGFAAWQQEHWLYHCGDGCAYLGPVGAHDLDGHAGALEMLLHEHDDLGWGPEESRHHVDGLDAQGQSTAYLFRCLHCGKELAFSDSA